MTTAHLPTGWLTDDEAAQLVKLAKGNNVLELGAYKGRSTVAMSEAAAFVMSVDRHRGIPPSWPEDSLDDYLSNTRDLKNVAKVIIEDWSALAALLNPGAFHFIYVDGDHSYGAVKLDILIVQVLRPKVVAFHDFDIPEVKAAATDILGNDYKRVDSLAWYRL